MKQHDFLLLTWSRSLFITECYADCYMYFLIRMKSHRSKLSIEFYYELFDLSGECGEIKIKGMQCRNTTTMYS